MSADGTADTGSSPVDPSRSSTPQDAGGGGENQGDTPEVEVVDGSRSGSVPVVKPALIYNKIGAVLKVDQRIVEAVDRFHVPDGFVRKGSREQSYMYSLGAYCEQTNGANHKYFCLAGSDCRRTKRAIPCKNGDRSNVNTHLKGKHEMQGTAGVKKEAKKKGAQEGIKGCPEASRNSGLGTNRVRELLAAKMVVEKFLPFSFFSSGTTWKELISTVTAKDAPFPALTSRRVKHLLAEMFVATKKAVVGNMQEEIQKAPLPIIHYGLDLWTCIVSGRKFLDVHAFYVDSNFVLRHALLAVKHYAPSAAAQETARASEYLFTIFKPVLAEFGIRLSCLAGGTTGSGPDVKAMCINFLRSEHKIHWDWCGCHLADEAAENALGTSADPQKSENKEARKVIQLVIEAAAKVNQSAAFKHKFDEAQLEMLDTTLRITKYAPQRCLSLVRVMERIIRLWHVLEKVYGDEGVEFPLDRNNNRDDILQLYSLLRPLSAIGRDGQHGTTVPMSAEMHLAFAELKKDVLDPEESLRVFNIPARPGFPEAVQAEAEAEAEHQGEKGRPPLPHTMVKPGDLRPVTVKVREKLRKALLQRFYSRLWDKDKDTASPSPSPFREAAVLLTPSYKDVDFHGALALTASDADHLPPSRKALAPTPDREVERKLDGCWADIKRRASEAAREERSRAGSTGKAGQPPAKRTRVLDAAKAKPRFASLGRTRARGDTGDFEGLDSEERVLLQQVTGDLERYQALYVTPEELDTRDVLPWWRRKGRKMFPFLAPVAQQVFGNQASASQAERDFSGCGVLLVPNRSRIDTYWAEMVMFLHVNSEHTPALEDIPIIAAKDVGACLPARFTGGNDDLAAAEAAFDVLNNTANSDIGL